MSTELKVKDESLGLDKNYKDFLNEVKARLRTAQIRASLAANSELVKFYWQLGIDMIERQKKYRWGENFLEQFSNDMRRDLPGVEGYSVTNLKRMRRVALQYPKGPQPVAQIPWGHISVLIHQVKDMAAREWYIQAIIKNGWSRPTLEMQIESGLYQRQGLLDNKLSNYSEHLPPAQSDLANELLKDPYNFNFLTVQGKVYERAIEGALVTHVRDFLLELGQGFAFVGSQVPLTFLSLEFALLCCH